MFPESTTDIILLSSCVCVCVCVALDPVSRNDRFGQDAFSIRYAKNHRPVLIPTTPLDRYIIMYNNNVRCCTYLVTIM